MKHKNFIIYGVLITALVLGFLAGFLNAFASDFFTGVFRERPVCEIKDFNPTCAPGEIGYIEPKDICTKSAERKKVSEKLAQKIFKNYNIPYDRKANELDHRIPNWMGGTETELNLWPQSSPDYRMKDKVEYLLYRRYCKGLITFNDALFEMHNWKNTYDKYFNGLGGVNYDIDRLMQGFEAEEGGNP